jgi:hypothetical protein
LTSKYSACVSAFVFCAICLYVYVHVLDVHLSLSLLLSAQKHAHTRSPDNYLICDMCEQPRLTNEELRVVRKALKSTYEHALAAKRHASARAFLMEVSL